MTVWTQDLAVLQRAEPSALLTHLTGEHAARIAGLWPAPHAEFITAPTDRRHLTCFVLSQPDERLDRSGARALLQQPMRLLIRELGDAAPPGLARALAHAGEVAWAAEDYSQLAIALRTFGLSARLRHAPSISPATLAVLRILPAELRDAGLCAVNLTPAQAELLVEIFQALVARDGHDAALRQARTWAGSSTRDIMQAVRTSLAPPTARPPFLGSGRLRPVDSAEALLDAARRYRNCLANYLYAASTGSSAFYEWVDAPGAIVELQRDPLFGWRLEQARGPNNAAVPQATRAAITDILRGWGVQVGRGYWELRNALDDAEQADFALGASEEAANDAYGGG